MSDITISGPIFRFEPGTVGKLHNREIHFVRYANTGYLVDVRPSAEAESIPAIMRGTRPDVEFVGRKVIPHAELAEALVAGTLDIDESDFVFIPRYSPNAVFGAGEQRRRHDRRSRRVQVVG